MTRIQADIVERSAEIVNLNVDEGAISGSACFDVKIAVWMKEPPVGGINNMGTRYARKCRV